MLGRATVRDNDRGRWTALEGLCQPFQLADQILPVRGLAPRGGPDRLDTLRRPPFERGRRVAA